jgi:hypothetical protein
MGEEDEEEAEEREQKNPLLVASGIYTPGSPARLGLARWNR